MNYLDENLLNHEHIVLRARQHWIIFFSTACWLVLAAIFLSLPESRHIPLPFLSSVPLPFTGLLFVLLTIYDGALSYASYYSREFAVTNKRVLAKIGIFRRESVEILMTKVEGIQIEQGIIGQILNYGSIIIIGTGGTHDVFLNVGNPLQFRKIIQEQIENLSTAQQTMDK